MITLRTASQDLKETQQQQQQQQQSLSACTLVRLVSLLLHTAESTEDKHGE
jgi:hypothetical protein